MHPKLHSALYEKGGIKLHNYELKNDFQPIVFINAQGVDSTSFSNVFKDLAKKYHIYAVDCYGHGKSLHDPNKYNIKDILEAIIQFLQDVVKDKAVLLGHSSGGLIAAYIAATTDLCFKIIFGRPSIFFLTRRTEIQDFQLCGFVHDLPSVS